MGKNSTNVGEISAVENHGSAAFQKKYLWADLQAGVITALWQFHYRLELR